MATSYRNIAIPWELGRRLQQLLQLDAVPRTLDELSLPASANVEPCADRIVARLVSASPMRRQVRISGKTVYTYCVVDACMLPVLRGAPAEIDSLDPETGDRIWLQVTPQVIVENSAAYIGRPRRRSRSPYLGSERMESNRGSDLRLAR